MHDVAWSPTGSHFIVIAGFMPAKTVLFDAKCGLQLSILVHQPSTDTGRSSWVLSHGCCSSRARQ